MGSAMTGSTLRCLTVAVILLAGCVFPDMRTETPAQQPDAVVQATDGDAGVSVEEAIAQVERLRELEAATEKLNAAIEEKQALIEQKEALIKQLEDEARERRARHVEKFGSAENLAMLAAAVALAALASRPWRRHRGDG